MFDKITFLAAHGLELLFELALELIELDRVLAGNDDLFSRETRHGTRSDFRDLVTDVDCTGLDNLRVDSAQAHVLALG